MNFTPKQQQTLLSKMGYQGPEDPKMMEAFIASNPAAAAKMGKFSRAMQKRTGMATGGMVSPTANFASSNTPVPTGGQTVGTILKDPTKAVTTPEVAKIGPATPDQLISESAGQVMDQTQASTTTVGQAAQADTPNVTPAATYEATTTAGQVQQANAAQGTVSEEAKVEAAQGSDLQQLNLEAAQIAQAETIKAPAERVLQQGELIEGSSVDMNKVNEAVQFEAAQAVPSKAATVQGQLEQLTENFSASNPPAWAAGALRAASAQMAARGLGASSMAGQAVVQATLESAIPIAMADAQTRAQFEAQNLSNRQQTAMFAAQQRAQFLGMEFTQDFQAKVANAARIGEIANINFTAEQQIALENARMAQSVSLANLDARSAKVLADAAALTQLDLTNLNNRQQAAVANAKSFLDMDMANLSNEQQTELFNTQNLVNSLFSDQAAENAAQQFNAASENQVNQFFADLSSNVSRFNSDQRNAISQFNAGETNAIAKFNAQLEEARNQFNASNSLIIAQANAKWRQDNDTLDTAAQNAANMEAARTANGLTVKALDDLWQRERDIMAFAFTGSQNDLTRANDLLQTRINANANLDMAKAKIDFEKDTAKSAMIYDFFFKGLF